VQVPPDALVFSFGKGAVGMQEQQERLTAAEKIAVQVQKDAWRLAVCAR
jgi:hypothetical protein